MERKKHQPEQWEGVARETALKFGCEAVEWWQSNRDPRRLFIKAQSSLERRKSFPIILEAEVPTQAEPCSHTSREGFQRPTKKLFRLFPFQRP